MKIKSLFLSLVFLATGGSLFAQNVLPNLNYNGQLTSACTTANTACTNAVFVTALGTSGTALTSGAGSTLDIPVANYAAATVTISGTYSGVTIAFDFSDPTAGTNYFQEVCARTDVNILEASEVVPTNQVRAWQCPVWGTMRFRVRASAYSSGSANINITITQMAIDPSLIVAAAPPVVPGSTDPCQDLSQQKQSFAVNVSSATTTAVVPVSGTTSVYVCGWSLQTVSGTTPTIQFEFGAGTACATSPSVLTGTFTGAALQLFNSPSTDTTILKAPSGNGFCLITGGTTPNVQGVITFVQQ